MDYGTTLREREYGLAAWFLVSTGRDLMSSNQPQWVSPERWWPAYGLDLGSAFGNRYEWKNLLRRDFRCGTVLLNEPQAPPRTVELEHAFTRLDGMEVRGLTLAASSAAVLTLPCATARGSTQSTDGRMPSEATIK
jgi:hypothetical protein